MTKTPPIALHKTVLGTEEVLNLLRQGARIVPNPTGRYLTLNGVQRLKATPSAIRMVQRYANHYQNSSVPLL